MLSRHRAEYGNPVEMNKRCYNILSSDQLDLVLCSPTFFHLKLLIHIPLSGAAQFQAPTIMAFLIEIYSDFLTKGKGNAL